MPAAAVIPAPIAYIKVVAVKKFVVECLGPGAVGLVPVLAFRRPSLQRRAVVGFPAAVSDLHQLL